MNTHPIDFVITWVDGSNEEWNKKRALYRKDAGTKTDTRKRRYRDWDNLKYFFRAIEKYADWVNHIYMVTPGNYPEWLDINNEKITVVDQDTLVPPECVPTFNNCQIELFFHKIPGLSENFVYFNDDMFIIKQTRPEDFFINDTPCDTVSLSAIPAVYSADGKGIYGINVMDTRLVAKRFTKQDVLRNCGSKLFSLKNGRDLIKTFSVLPYKYITGFNQTHMPHSYKKSTYEKVWEKAADDLKQTCESRFRGEFNNCHWCIRFWQICEGNFVVRRNFGKFFDIMKSGDEDKVIDHIKKQKTKLICINDNIETDEEFDVIVKKVNAAFDELFKEKSGFEK